MIVKVTSNAAAIFEDDHPLAVSTSGFEFHCDARLAGKIGSHLEVGDGERKPSLHPGDQKHPLRETVGHERYCHRRAEQPAVAESESEVDTVVDLPGRTTPNDAGRERADLADG